MPTPPIDNQDYTTFDARLFEDADSPEVAYKRMHHRLVKFFDWRRAEGAEDLASEVIHRLLRNLAQGQTVEGDRPWSYVYTIANNVFHEHKRKKKVLVSLDSNPNLNQLAAMFDLEAVNHERKLQILQECIGELKPMDQELIVSYHLGTKENVDELMTKFGLSRNSLSIRAHRIRKQLKRRMMRKMEGI